MSALPIPGIHPDAQALVREFFGPERRAQPFGRSISSAEVQRIRYALALLLDMRTSLDANPAASLAEYEGGIDDSITDLSALLRDPITGEAD